MEPLVSGDIPAQCRDRFSNSGDLSRDGLPKAGFTVNSADSLVLLLYLRHPIFE